MFSSPLSPQDLEGHPLVTRPMAGSCSWPPGLWSGCMCCSQRLAKVVSIACDLLLTFPQSPKFLLKKLAFHHLHFSQTTIFKWLLCSSHTCLEISTPAFFVAYRIKNICWLVLSCPTYEFITYTVLFRSILFLLYFFIRIWWKRLFLIWMSKLLPTKQKCLEHLSIRTIFLS